MPSTSTPAAAEGTSKLPRLSQIARDPVLAAFFERGARDSGDAFAVPASPKPVLTGGAVKALEYA